MKKAFAFIFFLFPAFLFGQIQKPISWSIKASKTNVNIGEELELIFRASIDDNWYLYSSDFDPDLGPMVTTFEFEDHDSYQLLGGIIPINPKKKYDDIWEGDYTYFKGTGEFRQKIKITADNPVIKGLYSYQVCSDVDGKCIPFEDDFAFDNIKVAVNQQPQTRTETAVARTDDNQAPSFSAIDTSSTSGKVFHPVAWKVSLDTETYKTGDIIHILFEATIEDHWYLYTTNIDIVPGPLPTEFTYNENSSFELVEDAFPVDPKTKYDKIFEGDVEYFERAGLFKQKIKVLEKPLGLSGNISFQVCNEEQCISDEYDFKIGTSVKGSKPSNAETIKGEGASLLKSRDTTSPYSLLAFLVVAFLAGLAAIFTPCVFPMIPMTVSFFTGKAKTRAQGVRNALFYGFSIILIYTLTGALIAPFMGPSTANEIATNAFLNVIFFLVFFVFALSFFGLFDINLPNSFVNKLDKKSDQGGLIGVFFMAFTLVVVSFSCTGPIAGALLFESAGGLVLKPILGMFAFGLAFAIPFTLFAIFPEWLNSLPKSGGWLNSVKVVLGFVELGFSLKFLSVADQVSHWGVLDREVYLAIWIVILLLLGFYLLGKIKLPHDSDLKYIPVPRFMLAITVFSFAVYLVPGLWGAPLKSLSGYMPPTTTQDFNLSKLLIQKNISNNNSESTLCQVPRYAGLLELPHGLEGYFDYDEAIACAKEKGKPIFIDFTGHGCVNCREMEAKVWSHPSVLKILREDYIILALYVDDRTKLPENEQYVSKYDGRLKNTIGRKNMDIELSKFGNNAQPYYVLIGPDEKPLTEPLGYSTSIEKFVEFLERGKKNFHTKSMKN